MVDAMLCVLAMLVAAVLAAAWILRAEPADRLWYADEWEYYGGPSR